MIFHEEVHVCVQISPFPFPVDQQKRNRVRENFFSLVILLFLCQWIGTKFGLCTTRKEDLFNKFIPAVPCVKGTLVPKAGHANLVVTVVVAVVKSSWPWGDSTPTPAHEVFPERTTPVSCWSFISGNRGLVHACVDGALESAPSLFISFYLFVSLSSNFSVPAAQFHFSRAGLKIEALHFLLLCRCLRLSTCLSTEWLIYFFMLEQHKNSDGIGNSALGR